MVSQEASWGLMAGEPTAAQATVHSKGVIITAGLGKHPAGPRFFFLLMSEFPRDLETRCTDSLWSVKWMFFAGRLTEQRMDVWLSYSNFERCILSVILSLFLHHKSSSFRISRDKACTGYYMLGVILRVCTLKKTGCHYVHENPRNSVTIAVDVKLVYVECACWNCDEYWQ